MPDIISTVADVWNRRLQHCWPHEVPQCVWINAKVSKGKGMNGTGYCH